MQKVAPEMGSSALRTKLFFLTQHSPISPLCCLFPPFLDHPMSLLQDQLKRLGTADLRNVTEISRRHKPSLLFNSREAADYDLETIYSIAHNGIMELTILDEKFGPFEKTLFSESMKSVDRVLQVKIVMTIEGDHGYSLLPF